MLLSASISLFRGLDRVLDDIAIVAEPAGRLDELAALDLKDLHPAAAFVVGRGDVERRDEASKGVVDRLQALFDVVPSRLLAAVRLQGTADRIDIDRRLQQAAVV